MKDEKHLAFIPGVRLEGGIRTAVEAWCKDRAVAKDQYGPIASWNTSEITNMAILFRTKAGFNEDISRWDVSNVTSLISTFGNATSFNGDLTRWDVSNVTIMNFAFSRAKTFDQQLGDAWARSKANKDYMFRGSAGSIVGKTKDASGTPV